MVLGENGGFIKDPLATKNDASFKDFFVLCGDIHVQQIFHLQPQMYTYLHSAC